jgi:hypothetical protein
MEVYAFLTVTRSLASALRDTSEHIASTVSKPFATTYRGINVQTIRAVTFLHRNNETMTTTMTFRSFGERPIGLRVIKRKEERSEMYR